MFVSKFFNGLLFSSVYTAEVWAAERGLGDWRFPYRGNSSVQMLLHDLVAHSCAPANEELPTLWETTVKGKPVVFVIKDGDNIAPSPLGECFALFAEVTLLHGVSYDDALVMTYINGADPAGVDVPFSKWEKFLRRWHKVLIEVREDYNLSYEALEEELIQVLLNY